jgi:hypothetical protein
MNYLQHYRHIEKENEKVIGNTYLIKKQYWYANKIITEMFIAKLTEKKYNVSITYNHSLVHYYYFDFYCDVINNEIIFHDGYNIPYTTSYVPCCDHLNLFSTHFYKKIHIIPSLKKEIHTHAFKKVKSQFKKKTNIPEFLLTYIIEDLI